MAWAAAEASSKERQKALRGSQGGRHYHRIQPTPMDYTLDLAAAVRSRSRDSAFASIFKISVCARVRTQWPWLPLINGRLVQVGKLSGGASGGHLLDFFLERYPTGLRLADKLLNTGMQTLSDPHFRDQSEKLCFLMEKEITATYKPSLFLVSWPSLLLSCLAFLWMFSMISKPFHLYKTAHLPCDWLYLFVCHYSANRVQVHAEKQDFAED